MRSSRLIPPIAVLFYSNLSMLIIGMGLFPILPFYAAQFGASTSSIGIFFGGISLALSAGSFSTAYLAARFPLKLLFISSVAAGVPFLVLLGQVSAFWHVVLFTSMVWFFGGMNQAIIHMLAGVYSEKSARGRSFSLLALTVPLGALLGGAGVGAMLQKLSFDWLFLAFGILWSGVPVAGALFLPAETSSAASGQPPSPQKHRLYRLDEPFTSVLLISMISATAISFGRLGPPLIMKAAAFSPTQVSTTAMVSGLVALPAVLIGGSFSDRVSRSRMLVMAYLFAAAGLAVLGLASLLWHYWLSTSLVLVSFCLSGALAAAVAVDVLHPAEVKRGLAWLNTALPAASVIAYTSTGFFTELFGSRAFFLLAAVLPLAAAALMETALQRCRRSLAPSAELDLKLDPWEENTYIKRCL